VEKALAERPAEAEEEDIRDTGARAEEEDDDERRLDEQEERLRWCAAEVAIVALEKISRKGGWGEKSKLFTPRITGTLRGDSLRTKEMRRALLIAGLASLGLGVAHALSRGHVRRRLRRLLRPQPPSPAAADLASIEAVVFDCDGVIYRNSVAIAGVAEALAALRRSGKRIFFVTNAASASRASLAAKLTKLGIQGVEASHCVTSSWAAAAYLKTHHPEVKRAYAVGGSGLLDELRLAGIDPVGDRDVGGLEALVSSGGLNDEVDAVVVGLQTEELCYARLAKASAYARDHQRPFVGTNPDNSFPGGLNELIPAGGCNVKFVSFAAEREPDAIVGKPSPDLARLVTQLHALKPEATLMVGDRCNTDVAFGITVGWRTMLVLTGCHQVEDLRAAAIEEFPDYVAQSAADLGSWV
jgi:phosphoglycolate/pyridoxal phosphate phosphatase family enzyme